jgi:hypothetical protein
MLCEDDTKKPSDARRWTCRRENCGRYRPVSMLRALSPQKPMRSAEESSPNFQGIPPDMPEFRQGIAQGWVV